MDFNLCLDSEKILDNMAENEKMRCFLKNCVKSDSFEELKAMTSSKNNSDNKKLALFKFVTSMRDELTSNGMLKKWQEASVLLSNEEGFDEVQDELKSIHDCVAEILQQILDEKDETDSNEEKHQIFCESAWVLGMLYFLQNSGGIKSGSHLKTAFDVILYLPVDVHTTAAALFLYSSAFDRDRDAALFSNVNTDFFNRLLQLSHVYRKRLHLDCNTESSSQEDCVALVSILRIFYQFFDNEFQSSHFFPNTDDYHRLLHLLCACLKLQHPNILVTSLKLLFSLFEHAHAIFFDTNLKKTFKGLAFEMLLVNLLSHHSCGVRAHAYLCLAYVAVREEDIQLFSKDYVGKVFWQLYSNIEDVNTALGIVFAVTKTKVDLLRDADLFPYICNLMKHFSCNVDTYDVTNTMQLVIAQAKIEDEVEISTFVSFMNNSQDFIGAFGSSAFRQ